MLNFDKKKGHSLIELMIVISIISFLSMLSIPSLMRFLAKAKRAEAYINLSSLAMAQKTYWAENGHYTKNLGYGGLNWKPEGDYNYTYGFSDGTEGVNYYTGNLKASVNNLSGSRITDNGFIIRAAADIDGDNKSDILEIDENNKIRIIENDLA